MRPILAAALIAPLGAAATAQTMDITDYQAIQDVEVVTEADGQEVGEIEEVLVDGTGEVVAAVVEVDDGFLDLGDSDVVIQLDDLTWNGGEFTTSLTEGQMQSLPTWDD